MVRYRYPSSTRFNCPQPLPQPSDRSSFVQQLFPSLLRRIQTYLLRYQTIVDAEDIVIFTGLVGFKDLYLVFGVFIVESDAIGGARIF